MRTPKIKSTAILIGYDINDRCVYSDILDVSDYYDGEHVWDDSRAIKRLKLRRVKEYIFNPKGELDQESETYFDPSTGKFDESASSVRWQQTSSSE